MSCDMCATNFSADSFAGWMNEAKSHYTEAHPDIMQNKAGLSEEDKMKDMQAWMTAAQARFEAAPETD